MLNHERNDPASCFWWAFMMAKPFCSGSMLGLGRQAAEWEARSGDDAHLIFFSGLQPIRLQILYRKLRASP